MKLFTIGYEGSSLEDFVRTLEHIEIKVLIDIRELPISRKRGFAKSALSQAVRDVGIEYIHLRELGDPKPGREAARAGEFKRFETIFRRHIERDASRTQLMEAVDIAKTQRACLLCFERCHKSCHRSIVASEMVLIEEFSIFHVGVQNYFDREERSPHGNQESANWQI